MTRFTPGSSWLAIGLAAASCATSSGRGNTSTPGVQARPLPDAATNSAASPMPSPARARRGAAVLANLACERCHEDEAREWRGSLHQRANVEPAYRRAFAREPFPFCRSCHAPEADPETQESAEESALGVGCVTCHVTSGDDTVLAAPARGARGEAPHPLVRDPRFASPAACAGCHEFAFPTASRRLDGDMMQTTIREHAASTSAAVSCASCHMPDAAGGRRGHGFAASRDPAFVRSAVRVEVARIGAERVWIVLSPRTPGHAFPTGDLFRRLEITAEIVGPDEMVLGSAARYLTRHFAPNPTQGGKRLVSDDRLRDAPITVELHVGTAAQGRTIAWRVAYQRVAHPDGVGDAEAELEGEIPLASGRLAP